MLEIRGDTNLAEETVGAEHGAEIRIEHLDRSLSLVAEAVCQIDRGHRATSDVALDVVPARQ